MRSLRTVLTGGGRMGPVRRRGPLVATVALLAAANICAHVLFPGAGLAVNAVLLAGLVGVARWARLSADDLGLARADQAKGARWALAILAGAALLFGVALAMPWLRDMVADVPVGNAWLRVLVTIPLGTVLVEEFAFRGVLWGMLRRDHGEKVATYGSAALFGLWHVLAALGGGAANATLEAVAGDSGAGTVAKVAGTVVFTFAAGMLFAGLRARSGSLLPPAALHWASNGLGVLYVALVA